MSNCSHVSWAWVAAVLLPAGCAPDVGGGANPEVTEVEPPVSVTAGEWLFGSENWRRYAPLREAAMDEMRRMPPEEYGPFMRRNGWKERWPELWGQNGVFRGPGLFQPPEAVTPEVLERLRDMADRAVEVGVWTGSEADAHVERLIDRRERTMSEHIEKHAREWMRR